MGEPPYSGPVAAEWTYSGDAVLDADPSTFRGYAENTAKIGSNLQDDMMGPTMLLHGGGEDISLSTGNFPEGSYCDQLNSRNATEMTSFIQDLRTNLAAIPSVAHILADLYEGMDTGNNASLSAVQWAFGTPGAEKPANLPEYLEEGKTIEDYMQENGTGGTNAGDDVLISTSSHSGATVATYRTADGGTRTVVRTPDGMTETGYTKDGTITYQVSTQPSGASTTHSYNPKGELTSTTTRATNETTSGNVTHRTVTATTVDAEGDVQSRTTDHIVTTAHNDGTQSREYYTTERVEDEDGNVTTERSGERYITAQPEAMTTEDWMERTEQTIEQARREVGS